jgi:hypothetical protein
MAHRILWAVAGLLAALALVAGCVNVQVPKGPYVVAGTGQPSQASRDRVHAMDRQALENEVLRLAAENDSLRQNYEKVKREKRQAEDERDRYHDQVERLQDQIRSLTSPRR